MSVDVMITGGAGMLAHALSRVFTEQGRQVALLTRADLDVTNEAAVHTAVSALKPRFIIQCAAYTQVDRAEEEEDLAHLVNATATAYVAAAANEVGARLIYPSTDYVFDGAGATPYPTDHMVAPINAYGRSKAAGEAEARAAVDSLIVRTSWLYGGGGRNFVRTISGRAAAGEPLRVIGDQTGSPTYAYDAAVLISRLCDTAPAGVYHATNAGATTWFGLAQAVVQEMHLDAEINETKTSEYPTLAIRPRYSVLDCERTYELVGPAADWRDALKRALKSTDF